MSETLIVNYLIKGRVKMNVEELVQKAKDLIGKGDGNMRNNSLKNIKMN